MFLCVLYRRQRHLGYITILKERPTKQATTHLQLEKKGAFLICNCNIIDNLFRIIFIYLLTQLMYYLLQLYSTREAHENPRKQDDDQYPTLEFYYNCFFFKFSLIFNLLCKWFFYVFFFHSLQILLNVALFLNNILICNL